MQIITIAGVTGKDAVYRSTNDGSPLCSFSVAVSTGWGDRKATTWWDVTRWGKGADKLTEMLVKGTKVSVSGEFSTREHDGKTYLQVRADHVTLQGGRQEQRQDRGGGVPNNSNGGYTPPHGGAADLDDDVPF